MEESKKKTTSTKSETNTSTKKKADNKKNVPKNVPEKEEFKANVTKKTSSKKSNKKKSVSKTTSVPSNDKTNNKSDKNAEINTAKKIEKVEEKKTIKEPEKVDNNTELEKTIIFDGRQKKNISDVVNKLEEEHVVLEDKVIKRNKGKKIAIIILSIAIIAIVLATSLYVIDELKTYKENSKTVDSDIYKKVSEKYKKQTNISENKDNNKEETIYSNIETLSLAQFEEKALSREDITIMVASETCYASMSFEPIVNEVFKDLNKTIYKINISKLSSEEIDIFRTYYAFKSTPTIFTIKAGIVTADNVGSISQEDLTEWVKENVQ